jgi:hypothetical protein
MTRNWAIGREIVTEESAAIGETESRTWDGGLTFREAVRAFLDAPAEQGVEADSFPISEACPPRWFVAYGGMDYKSGDWGNTSLFIPPQVTPASRMRVARLVGCYGAKARGDEETARLRLIRDCHDTSDVIT